jgi:hypothetical protein
VTEARPIDRTRLTLRLDGDCRAAVGGNDRRAVEPPQGQVHRKHAPAGGHVEASVSHGRKRDRLVVDEDAVAFEQGDRYREEVRPSEPLGRHRIERLVTKNEG